MPLLLALPGVEEGPCYGTAGFRVRKKFLARLRDHDEVLVVKCGFDERDFRLRADPDTFFTTDHYKGYPTVLVRLERVDAADLGDLLEHAWRQLATDPRCAWVPASSLNTTNPDRAA